MFQYIVENAGKIVPLVFGLLAALSFAATVGAGFFGITLPADTAELLKTIIYVSIGVGANATANYQAQRAQVMKEQNAKGKV